MPAWALVHNERLNDFEVKRQAWLKANPWRTPEMYLGELYRSREAVRAVNHEFWESAFRVAGSSYRHHGRYGTGLANLADAARYRVLVEDLSVAWRNYQWSQQDPVGIAWRLRKEEERERRRAEEERQRAEDERISLAMREQLELQHIIDLEAKERLEQAEAEEYLARSQAEQAEDEEYLSSCMVEQAADEENLGPTTSTATTTFTTTQFTSKSTFTSAPATPFDLPLARSEAKAFDHDAGADVPPPPRPDQPPPSTFSRFLRSVGLGGRQLGLQWWSRK
jgi:hypothetical protein